MGAPGALPVYSTGNAWMLAYQVMLDQQELRKRAELVYSMSGGDATMQVFAMQHLLFSTLAYRREPLMHACSRFLES